MHRTYPVLCIPSEQGTWSGHVNSREKASLPIKFKIVRESLDLGCFSEKKMTRDGNKDSGFYSKFKRYVYGLSVYITVVQSCKKWN